MGSPRGSGGGLPHQNNQKPMKLFDRNSRPLRQPQPPPDYARHAEVTDAMEPLPGPYTSDPPSYFIPEQMGFPSHLALPCPQHNDPLNVEIVGLASGGHSVSERPSSRYSDARSDRKICGKLRASERP